MELDVLLLRRFLATDDITTRWSSRVHRRPFVGYPSLALPRSWSHFVGNCCQKLTNLIGINF